MAEPKQGTEPEPETPKASTNGNARRKPRQIDAVAAEVEGLHGVANNAFNASGAALLLAIVALGLAIFLLFRVRAFKAVTPK